MFLILLWIFNTSLTGCPGGKRGARGADRDGVWDLQEARLRVHARVQADRERASGRVGPWKILNPHSQITLWRRLGGNGAGLSWSHVFASQKTKSKTLVRLYMLEILPLMNWQWKYCEESHIPSRSIGLRTLPFIWTLFDCRWSTKTPRRWQKPGPTRDYRDQTLCKQCSSNQIRLFDLSSSASSWQIFLWFLISIKSSNRYLERKLGGRRISVGTMKRSSLMDLLDAGLVIEEQVDLETRERKIIFSLSRFPPTTCPARDQPPSTSTGTRDERTVT